MVIFIVVVVLLIIELLLFLLLLVIISSSIVCKYTLRLSLFVRCGMKCASCSGGTLAKPCLDSNPTPESSAPNSRLPRAWPSD